MDGRVRVPLELAHAVERHGRMLCPFTWGVDPHGALHYRSSHAAPHCAPWQSETACAAGAPSSYSIAHSSAQPASPASHASAHASSALHEGLATHAFISAAHPANRQDSHADSGTRDGHCALHSSDAQPPSRKLSEMPAACAVKHVCWHGSSPEAQTRKQLASAAHSGFSWHVQKVS